MYYILYVNYHSVSFNIIQYHSHFQDVALCHLVSSCFDWLLWPTMVTMASFPLFSSPAFAPASFDAMTAGGAPVRLPKGLRWAVAVAVNSFRDVRF